MKFTCSKLLKKFHSRAPAPTRDFGAFRGRNWELEPLELEHGKYEMKWIAK
jgi:hypothetical protein